MLPPTPRRGEQTPAIPLWRGIKGEGKKHTKNMKAGKENHLLYNSKLQPYARELRHTLTKAEACLWKYALRAKQLKGYGFNRQRPVLNYIADFMCKNLKLIIEVDGYSHLLDKVIEKDKKKQNDLEKAGFTILRFKDEEVLKNINGVRQAICDMIEILEIKDKSK